jgi:hypothetical protein
VIIILDAGPFLNSNTKSRLEELMRTQEAEVGDYQWNSGSGGRGRSRSTGGGN